MSQLQEDLDSIFKWIDTNNLEMNSKKLEILRYTTNVQLATGTSYISNTFNEKECLHDLGVTMSNSADFKLHITEILKKATK